MEKRKPKVAKRIRKVSTVLVKPSPGLKVCNPDREGQYLSEVGEHVPRSLYWLHRIRDGDVIEIFPPAAMEEAPREFEWTVAAIKEAIETPRGARIGVKLRIAAIKKVLEKSSDAEIGIELVVAAIDNVIDTPIGKQISIRSRRPTISLAINRDLARRSVLKSLDRAQTLPSRGELISGLPSKDLNKIEAMADRLEGFRIDFAEMRSRSSRFMAASLDNAARSLDAPIVEARGIIDWANNLIATGEMNGSDGEQRHDCESSPLEQFIRNDLADLYQSLYGEKAAAPRGGNKEAYGPFVDFALSALSLSGHERKPNAVHFALYGYKK